MKEQDLMCIKLHGVSKVGLRKIIDFIYTAKLSLNMDNLQDTLEAASFLQILPVLDFCKVFLISGVRHSHSFKAFPAGHPDVACLETDEIRCVGIRNVGRSRRASGSACSGSKLRGKQYQCVFTNRIT